MDIELLATDCFIFFFYDLFWLSLIFLQQSNKNALRISFVN